MKTPKQILEIYNLDNDCLFGRNEEEISLEILISEIQKDCKQEYEDKLRWIPVKERLPERVSTVLVRDSSTYPSRMTALYQDGIFYPDFLLKNENVTHWRNIQ